MLKDELRGVISSKSLKNEGKYLGPNPLSPVLEVLKICLYYVSFSTAFNNIGKVFIKL